MKPIYIDTLELFEIKKATDKKLRNYQILALIGDEKDIRECIRKNRDFANLYEYFLINGKTILIVPPPKSIAEQESSLADPTERVIRFCKKLIRKQKKSGNLKLPLYVLLIRVFNC